MYIKAGMVFGKYYYAVQKIMQYKKKYNTKKQCSTKKYSTNSAIQYKKAIFALLVCLFIFLYCIFSTFFVLYFLYYIVFFVLHCFFL